MVAVLPSTARRRPFLVRCPAAPPAVFAGPPPACAPEEPSPPAPKRTRVEIDSPEALTTISTAQYSAPDASPSSWMLTRWKTSSSAGRPVRTLSACGSPPAPSHQAEPASAYCRRYSVACSAGFTSASIRAVPGAGELAETTTAAGGAPAGVVKRTRSGGADSPEALTASSAAQYSVFGASCASSTLALWKLASSAPSTTGALELSGAPCSVSLWHQLEPSRP